MSVAIRQILREDYPCANCGAKRGDYCLTATSHKETSPHASRWDQYYGDKSRRRAFGMDLAVKKREELQGAVGVEECGPNSGFAAQIGITGDGSVVYANADRETFEPHRDDEVSRWLKRWRDRYDILDHGAYMIGAYMIDTLLDDYRLHADTGTPLHLDVHEADIE